MRNYLKTLLHREALTMRREILGEREHFEVTASLIGIADVLKQRGKYDEAETLLEECLALRRELLGPEHWRMVEALRERAELELLRGRPARAEVIYRDALELARRTGAMTAWQRGWWRV